MQRDRRAVSSTFSAIILTLLLTVFVAALLYAFFAQLCLMSTSAGTIEEVSWRAHENLQAWLISSSNGSVEIGVKNTGLRTSTVVAVLVVRDSGLLKTISLNPPVQVPLTVSPSCYTSITVRVAEYCSLAVLTSLGNSFPVRCVLNC